MALSLGLGLGLTRNTGGGVPNPYPPPPGYRWFAVSQGGRLVTQNNRPVVVLRAA